MKHLSDLPNSPGFKFIGVDHDYQEELTVVRLDSVGCCSTYRVSDGAPNFMNLLGWIEVAQEEDNCK